MSGLPRWVISWLQKILLLSSSVPFIRLLLSNISVGLEFKGANETFTIASKKFRQRSMPFLSVNT